MQAIYGVLEMKYHRAVGVAADALFEETCEFTVSVGWDVRGLVGAGVGFV